jgi:glycosyltransferase involved in cell wall biosynthesis
MFLIDTTPVEYVDPWKSSYEERLFALQKGDYRIAYYYETPDNSTFRYRIYNMIQALEASNRSISAAYFTLAEIDAMEKIVNLIDVLVVCRVRYSDKLNYIITKARNNGKLVFFDIDDLVFNLSYVHLVLDTLDQDLSHPQVWDFWYAYIGRMGATLNLCDRAITTNEYLAARIGSFFKRPVSVIPNFLNKEQMEISERIFLEKKSRRFERNGQVHLGYFSGTPTHNKDLDVMSDALVSLMEENERIILRVVGFMDMKERFEKFKSRIENYPLQNFVNLQRLIGETEINLIPLQDNEFTNCKSELKYFEAGIVGTVSIASPVFTYSKAINDGENAYLANSFEWYEKLKKLVNMSESYQHMAEKAFKDAEQKYAWYNQISLLEQILST